MSKHTLGPWKVDSRIAIVGDLYSRQGQHALYCADITRESGGLSICGIQSQDHCDSGITRDEAAANARLIAAAPELVEALERFCQIASGEPFDLTDSPKSLVTRINENRNDARALLRKIKGEA